MAAYLDEIHVELMLDGLTWTDVTQDVLQGPGIKFAYGIMGNGPLDRVAGTGKMEFTLRNDAGCSGGAAGYYTPGHPSCRSGFGAGIKARLRLVYDGYTFYKFFGRIGPQGIQLQEGPGMATMTRVSVLDYMEQLAIHPMYLPALATDKRLDEVVGLVLDNVPVQPQDTELNATEDTFEDVFDTVRSTTTALAEISKATASELGYVYVKRDRSTGEVLTVDGRYARSDDTAYVQAPIPHEDRGWLLTETRDYLLTEAGENLLLEGEMFDVMMNWPVFGTVGGESYLLTEEGGDLLMEDGEELVLDEIGLQYYQEPLTGIEVSHGRHLFNEARYTVYPRYVDALATTVLASLNSPIELAANQTRPNVLMRYRDPTGGAARISGRDMVTPVATTDYLMNSKADGTGTDMTASLTVTANYGPEGVNYTLQNTSATTTGFVTKLQCRGKGIYTYDPVTLRAEDAASKLVHGTRVLSMDFRYQKSILIAAAFADVFLDIYAEPLTVVDRATFSGNYSPRSMAVFLWVEPGDKIAIWNADAAISGNYFVNGVETVIGPGGMVRCTWTVQSEVYANISGMFWTLDTPGNDELGVNTYLGVG
jgi:hypothetical protein